jgi:hypothetical protein
METTSSQRRVRREQRSAKQRAKAMALRADDATLEEIGDALAVCPSRAAQILAKAKWLASRPQWHNGLNNTRALNFLRLCGLAELPEAEAAAAVSQFTRRELMNAPNLGKVAIGALAAWLERLGLTLRDEITVETNKKGVPASGRPCDSHSPLRAGRKASSTCEITASVT